MPFCKNCGSPVEAAFCPKCGIPAAVPAAGSYTPPPPAPQSYAPALEPAVATAPTPIAVESENLMAAVAYLGWFITGVLFLVLEPYNKSKFIRFHAVQSIGFSIACAAAWIVVGILSGIVSAILPWSIEIQLWRVFWLLYRIVSLGSFILWIVLMVKAYQNQRWSLPIIGPIAAKQAQ